MTWRTPLLGLVPVDLVPAGKESGTTVLRQYPDGSVELVEREWSAVGVDMAAEDADRSAVEFWAVAPDGTRTRLQGAALCLNDGIDCDRIEATLRAAVADAEAGLRVEPLQLRTWRVPKQRHPHLGSCNQTRAWRPAQKRRGRERREYIADLHTAPWPA